MRTIKFLTAIALAALMAGCAPSLHPLYTVKDVVFDRSLVGVWVSDDGDGHKDTWTLTKSGGNGYSMVSADDGEPARFEATLLRLNGQLYMDILPAEAPVDNDLYRSVLIRAHTFAKISLEDDVLSMALMDPESLKRLTEGKSSILPQAKLEDGGVLITASTKELQEFVSEHSDDGTLFGEMERFQRARADQ